MSHQAVTWAYEQDVKPSGAKFVLVTLANYANGEGYCFPGQDVLAEDTSQSVRAVRGHLDKLEADGIIVRQRRSNKRGHRKSDGYWLVGFKSLPADVAASLPADSSARDESLPADSAIPTGNYRQSLPADSAGLLKGINRQKEPSEEPSVKSAAAPARKRDLLFESVAEAWLGNPYPDLKLTKSQRGNVNACVTQLREIDADPSDVPRQWERIREMFDNPTPAALAKHWSTNGTGPKRGKDARHRNPIARARSLIASQRESGGASGPPGRIDERSSRHGRRADQDMGTQLPRLPDGRPPGDVG